MLIKDILIEDDNDLYNFKQDVKGHIHDSLDGLTTLPMTIDHFIEKGNIPIPKMAKVINKWKTEILNVFDDNYYLIDRASILGSIAKLNLNWPELPEIELNLLDEIIVLENINALKEMSFSNNLITNKKDILIKIILENLKTGDPELSKIIVSKLLKQGVNWPELEIIQRSLDADFAAKNSSLNEDADINRAPKSVQDSAIARNGNVIRYIENPTPDQLIKAIVTNGDAIRWIKNPHKDLQRIAINRNPYAIKYIKNPDEDIQLAAVKDAWDTISHIKNPTDKALVAAFDADYYGRPLDMMTNKDTAFFNANKDVFIKKLLTLVKKEFKDGASKMLQVLKRKGLDWPEFAIIERGIKALQPPRLW